MRIAFDRGQQVFGYGSRSLARFAPKAVKVARPILIESSPWPPHASFTLLLIRKATATLAASKLRRSVG